MSLKFIQPPKIDVVSTQIAAENAKNQYYDCRSMFGNDLAIFYIFLGGREAGKSYSIMDFYLREAVYKDRPFYWLRLTQDAADKLLANKAEKLIDPDLRRKYNLDLTTHKPNVYHVTKRAKDGRVLEKKLLCRVLPLSTFYTDKGNGYYDLEYLDNPNAYYNIALDEMNREKCERKTFDILYSFTNQIENLVRSTKTRIRIALIGNTLEEASDLLCGFNFLPEKFGRYSLIKNKKVLREYIREVEAARKIDRRLIAAVDEKYKDYDFGKRAVIEYIEPSETYKTRRHGTVADILMPNASTFTNEVTVDQSLISKKPLKRPSLIIAFGKNRSEKFTLWDDSVIAPYNDEKCAVVVAMRPYLDLPYNAVAGNDVVLRFNARGYQFKNLMTFKVFQKQMELLRPSR